MAYDFKSRLMIAAAAVFCASTMTAAPNLTTYKPSNWPNRLVLSTSAGTSVDSSSFTTADTLYIDWAVINSGTTATSAAFQTQLYVDTDLRATWSTSAGLQPGYYTYVTDFSLGKLMAGTHTVTIRTDTTNAIGETSESDNEYTRTITMSATRANLLPYQPSGWSNKVVISKTTGTNTDGSGFTTGDTLYIDWAILNNGGSPTAATFQTQLFVDSTLRATWSTGAPLNAGYYSYVTDYSLRKLTAGTHTLKIVTDATSAISETSEGDNEYTRTITVTALAANLLPYQPSGWSNKLVVSKTTGTNTDGSGFTTGDTLYIDWAILNNGGSPTAATFQAQLLLDGVVRATWSIGAPLNPDKYAYVADYNLGKLSAGNHTLRLKIDATNTVAETNETDNEVSRTITIAPRSFFNGIYGGSPSDVNDDPNRVLSIQRNDQIAAMLSTACGTTPCSPTNMNDLTTIANANYGGLVSIGFFMTSVVGGSSLNTPGNSEIPKAYILENYRPGDRVFIAGFSAGGGDAQNVLEKLDLLAIPVRVSGHIDSVEVGDDASIPKNTMVAKGFYQTQSAILVRGESNLVAKDASVTTITNTRITSPVGPANPQTDDYAYHRNMDNDPRVWIPLKDAITGAQQLNSELATAQLEQQSCIDCRSPKPLTVSRGLTRLRLALLVPTSSEELFDLREQLAAAIHSRADLDALVLAHATAPDDPRLQENLTAVLFKVNADGLLSDLEQIAAETTDYSLFVATAHSIARQGSDDAVKSIVRLIDANRLDVVPARVIEAVLSAYHDQRDARDAVWMLDWLRSERLSDAQMFAMTEMLSSESDSTVQSLRDEIRTRMRSDQFRHQAFPPQN